MEGEMGPGLAGCHRWTLIDRLCKRPGVQCTRCAALVKEGCAPQAGPPASPAKWLAVVARVCD